MPHFSNFSPFFLDWFVVVRCCCCCGYFSMVQASTAAIVGYTNFSFLHCWSHLECGASRQYGEAHGNQPLQQQPVAYVRRLMFFVRFHRILYFSSTSSLSVFHLNSIYTDPVVSFFFLRLATILNLSRSFLAVYRAPFLFALHFTMGTRQWKAISFSLNPIFCLRLFPARVSFPQPFFAAVTLYWNVFA